MGIKRNFVFITTTAFLLGVAILLFWHLSTGTATSPDSGSVAALASGSGESLQTLQLDKQEQAKVVRQEQAAHAAKAFSQKLAGLQDQIEDYLDHQPGKFGFMLYTTLNINGTAVPETIGDDQNASFKMASTYKVPVNLYLYEKAAQHKIDLNEKLVYEPQFYTTGTGSLQYQMPGGSYTIRELSSLSIRQSDNVALAILINKLGRENILAFMKSLGGTAIYQGTPWGTPNDLIIYMKAVSDFAQSNPSLGNLMLEDLEHTDFNDRIRAGTPSNVVVAHKIGNLDGYMNDIGIVYAPKGTYILALMSESDISPTVGAQVEAQVAKMVYVAIGK